MPTSSPRSSPAWSPSDRDRLIFRWARFDGMTQQWIAAQLDLHQSTVSRVLERYELWIARGGPAQAGGLTHEERIRYQRWLNYERNEWVITSALRLADDMQRPYDTSTSTVTNPPNDFGGHGTQIRTQHMALDRSANACRYLRLAFRVGQEQQKLVQQDELAPLEPLSVADLDPTLDEELKKPLRTLTHLSDNPNQLALTPNPPTPTPDLDLALDPDPPHIPSLYPSIPPTSPAANAPLAEESPPDPSAPATTGTPATTALKNLADEPVSTLEVSPNHPPLHKTHNANPTSNPCHQKPCSDNAPPQKTYSLAAYSQSCSLDPIESAVTPQPCMPSLSTWPPAVRNQSTDPVSLCPAGT